ncbi:MAG: hypothetical protein COB22_07520 [Cycloclasticus sp.]|nr:MAG: hypothetical protein COB22_07520 [Cycloclasticus sp.]
MRTVIFMQRQIIVSSLRWNTVLNKMFLTLFNKSDYRNTVLAIFVWALPSLVFAQPNLVIIDESIPHQATFYTSLKEHFADLGETNFVALSANKLTLQNINKTNPSLIINLNKDSARPLLGLNPEQTIIHTLLTTADVNKVMSCKPRCLSEKINHHFLVINQPVERQLALIKLVKPSAKDIGVIYSKESSGQFEALQNVAKKTPSLTINQFLTTAENVRFILNDVAQSSDIILALADSNIYNLTTLPQILLTSYRHRTPVLGFSKGFVKAGAISGVSSTLPQLAQHTAEIIKAFNQRKKRLSTLVAYPKYYTVTSNHRVANSLNLHFENDAELTTQLQSNDVSR